MHALLTASTAALAVLLWLRGLHRWYPVFWGYLWLAALSGLSWYPADPTWGRTVWLWMQPVLLVARLLVALECFSSLAWRVYRREGGYVLGMAGAVATACLLAGLAWPRADAFGMFLAGRQYFYLLLAVGLVAVRGYFWVRPTETCPASRAHGWILAGYFGVLFIGATTAKTGLAWLVIARTAANWQIMDTAVTGGCILCMVLWAIFLRHSRPDPESFYAGR